MKQFQLKIEGMSCSHCVRAVQGALEKVPGVSVHRVDVGSATGEFEPGQTSAQHVAAAVRNAGYDATVVDGAA
jgi:copper chaperone